MLNTAAGLHCHQRMFGSLRHPLDPYTGTPDFTSIFSRSSAAGAGGSGVKDTTFTPCDPYQPWSGTTTSITNTTTCSTTTSSYTSLHTYPFTSSASAASIPSSCISSPSSSSSSRQHDPVTSSSPPSSSLLGSLFSTDPLLWGAEHVRAWLGWVVREYSLHDVDPSKFPSLDGRDLCRLGRDDLNRLASPYSAEVLLSSLNSLRSQNKLGCK